jgi:hypothetical protein
MPKFVDSPQNSARIASYPWKIGPMPHETKMGLDKGIGYASLTLLINLIWGMSVQSLDG